MLNSSKTQCIFVGTRRLIRQIPPDLYIHFDNNPAIPSTHVKNLGVILNCHFIFDVHIHEMYKKVMGHLLFLNKVKDKFEPEIINTVLESLVLNVVNYCLPVRCFAACSNSKTSLPNYVLVERGDLPPSSSSSSGSS